LATSPHAFCGHGAACLPIHGYSFCFITAEKGGVARAKGVGEKGTSEPLHANLDSHTNTPTWHTIRTIRTHLHQTRQYELADAIIMAAYPTGDDTAPQHGEECTIEYKCPTFVHQPAINSLPDARHDRREGQLAALTLASEFIARQIPARPAAARQSSYLRSIPHTACWRTTP